MLCLQSLCCPLPVACALLPYSCDHVLIKHLLSPEFVFFVRDNACVSVLIKH